MIELASTKSSLPERTTCAARALRLPRQYKLDIVFSLVFSSSLTFTTLTLGPILRTLQVFTGVYRLSEILPFHHASATETAPCESVCTGIHTPNESGVS